MKAGMIPLSCGHSVPEAEILSAAARINAAKRKTRAGGRPKSTERCPCGCGLTLAVAMQRHPARARKGEE